MIEWLISDENVMIVMLLLLSSFLLLLMFNHAYLDSPKRSLKYLTRFLGVTILTLAVTISEIRSVPVSSHRWKTIYQNKDEVDVYLKYKRRGFLIINNSSFKSGDQLGEDFDVFKENHELEMVASKNGFERSKTVYLSKENIISDSEISENSKIVKIEYRKVDYYETRLKSYRGKRSVDSKHEYEVRVTLEKGAATEKELDKLLDQ